MKTIVWKRRTGESRLVNRLNRSQRVTGNGNRGKKKNNLILENDARVGFQLVGNSTRQLRNERIAEKKDTNYDLARAGAGGSAFAKRGRKLRRWGEKKTRHASSGLPQRGVEESAI